MTNHPFGSGLLTLALGLLFFVSSGLSQSATIEQSEVETAELGQTRNVHRVGNLFLSGQFTRDDITLIRERGIRNVISLRGEGELDWDEASLLEQSGIEFQSIPIGSADALTDDVFDQVRTELGKQDEPALLHCASANRVGAVWLAYRVLNQNVDWETAVAEAEEVGLRSPELKARAEQYIQQRIDRPVDSDTDEQKMGRQLDSVKPGINESFLSPDLDVDAYVERFEVESREVFEARERIVSHCGIKPGQRIADVGAGTGLFTRLFAVEAGTEGWVYAVDIAPRFLEHINADMDKLGIANVTTVLCPQDDIGLAPGSVDVIFVCDTYHHFEYPEPTLASMHRALKPGGTLIVIDFERIPGVSREWLLDHVRAGKDTVRSEIEAAGFRLVDEVEIPQFQENYFLKFTRE